MVPDATPDYCPFCGARLGDDPAAFDDHLTGHDDCAERFEAWREATRVGNSPGVSGGNASAGVQILTWLLVAVIIAYSLLVARQLLLGIVAAVLVYIASFLVRRTVLAG